MAKWFKPILTTMVTCTIFLSFLILNANSHKKHGLQRAQIRFISNNKYKPISNLFLRILRAYNYISGLSNLIGEFLLHTHIFFFRKTSNNAHVGHQEMLKELIFVSKTESKSQGLTFCSHNN